MQTSRSRKAVRTARLVAAALLLGALSFGSVASSSATVTQRDLDAAKAQLVSLNQQLSQLVEQFDQTKIALHSAETKLADAKADADRAAATAARTRSLLDARARSAYMNAGSELDLLLGSTTFSEFSERVQFLNGLAGQDADFAAQADLQGRQAELSSLRLADAVKNREDLLKSLDEKTSAIKAGIADQQGLIDQLKTELTKQQLAQVVNDPGPAPNPGPTPDPSPPPPPPPPPPPVPGAQTAVHAAYSAIGVPYLWGGDNPQEGFDCSGLTMWSWAQAGVSLPHSSAAQYAAIPHVSKDDLKPGDLLFFYQPISHVAIYVGHNQMIEAHHPGTSVSLDTIDSYWWAVFVGAGRPG
jgi:cell wall-associated NlpC family hydrolase